MDIGPLENEAEEVAIGKTEMAVELNRYWTSVFTMADTNNLPEFQGSGVRGSFPIRLANGNSNCSGRVEIFYNSTWGTVCDDGWDVSNGGIVCRQLNCGKFKSVTGAYYGQEGGQILLSGVRCNGTEHSLDQCFANPLGVNNSVGCQHAGVICSGSGLVRLEDGRNLCDGRVAIFHNSTWGTVCSDYWDLHDAQVVCRQLNCGRAIQATTGAFFGQGSGPIWLDDVLCDGTESSLDQCVAAHWGENNCQHNEDAGVRCSGSFPVRLADGNNICSGRVEILYKSTWGTVCDVGWNLINGDIVCRQLNCGEAKSVTGAYRGQGGGEILLSGVQCLYGW
ncbi:deleted in malignant brain tumors 1 protein-like [Rhincodon typus]|uniref:deleted in malignant brain tumors 1 protein-like n=1 Tax=Rhincodon typus TaxID=259920 RepID=UPI00202E7A00|nr:deleted in malignant brain tumors 1 protein-like [Rhincodon typus]